MGVWLTVLAIFDFILGAGFLLSGLANMEDNRTGFVLGILTCMALVASGSLLIS